jgi:hypothetical protein
MKNRSQFLVVAGRTTLVASLLVACLAAACDHSDSVGARGDGGRSDGKPGSGGAAPGGTGGSAGAGGAETGTGGTGRADAAADGYPCPLTNVYCPNGYVTDAYGCMVCAPYGSGGSGGGATTGMAGTGGISVGGSGGATAKGGASGSGSGGSAGSTAKGGAGGGGGADAATDGHECPPLTDVYCATYILDPYGCMVCASSGTGGSGGTTGKGGVGGTGGTGGTGGSGGAGGAIDGGLVACGTTACGAGEYCCNPACNQCVPVGITGCGPCLLDAGQEVDGNGCTARPESDATLCGGSRPPHYYTCTLTMLAAPCTMLSIGDVTNTFCCP